MTLNDQGFLAFSSDISLLSLRIYYCSFMRSFIVLFSGNVIMYFSRISSTPFLSISYLLLPTKKLKMNWSFSWIYLTALRYFISRLSTVLLTVCNWFSLSLSLMSIFDMILLHKALFLTSMTLRSFWWDSMTCLSERCSYLTLSSSSAFSYNLSFSCLFCSSCSLRA